MKSATSRLCAGLAAAAVLLDGGAALADDAPPRHEVSLGVNAFTVVRAPSLIMPQVTLDLAYHHTFDVGSIPELLRLTAGVRYAPSGQGTLPLEGYGRAELVAPMSVWKPTLGLELGASGLDRLFRAQEGSAYPEDSAADTERHLSPVYGAMTLSPLRFHFNRFTVSAAELHLGLGLADASSHTRLQLGVLRLGGTF